MRLNVHHRIVYAYNKAAFFEPMTVRLRPRDDCTQRVKTHHLEIQPAPAGKTDAVDLDGNQTSMIWFEGMHQRLSITSTSSVETLRTDPFDFIVTEPDMAQAPFSYSESLGQALRTYRQGGDPDESVKSFGQSVIKQVNGQTLPLLMALTAEIQKQVKYINRETGDAWSAKKTLREGRGSCRDLAVLFMDVSRAMGLAARFVSGYTKGDDQAEHELHAWAEVYVPGGGWRGFDPSLGLAVADQHVAIAASATPEWAAPTSGAFRGTGVTSKITYEVNVSKSP